MVMYMGLVIFGALEDSNHPYSNNEGNAVNPMHDENKEGFGIE